MLNNISELNLSLDDIINSGDDFVTPEQVAVMQKVLKASEVLRTRMKRAERGGISVGDKVKQLEEIEIKTKTFLREFGS